MPGPHGGKNERRMGIITDERLTGKPASKQLADDGHNRELCGLGSGFCDACDALDRRWLAEFERQQRKRRQRRALAVGDLAAVLAELRGLRRTGRRLGRDLDELADAVVALRRRTG
jgi:hypothetical protein